MDIDFGKTQSVNSVYSEPGKNCAMSTMKDGVQTSQTTKNKDIYIYIYLYVYNDYTPSTIYTSVVLQHINGLW